MEKKEVASNASTWCSFSLRVRNQVPRTGLAMCFFVQLSPVTRTLRNVHTNSSRVQADDVVTIAREPVERGRGNR
jgi:hypothetical protein